MLGIFGAIPFPLVLAAVYLPAAIGWGYGYWRGMHSARRGILVALGSFAVGFILAHIQHADGRTFLILVPLAFGLAGPALFKTWYYSLALSTLLAILAASFGMIVVVMSDCAFSATACL